MIIKIYIKTYFWGNVWQGNYSTFIILTNNSRTFLRWKKNFLRLYNFSSIWPLSIYRSSFFVKRVFAFQRYLQVKQYTTCVFTCDIWPGCEIPRLSSTWIQEVRVGTRKKGKKEAKGYRIRRKGLTRQSRHVSMPLGGVHGMWSRQPSVLSPPFAPLPPFLAHTYTHTNQRIPLSLSFLLPLRPSLHPSADQGTFHSAQRAIPPRTSSRP